jgi:hypothetical protein
VLVAECRQMLVLIAMPAGKLLRLPESWEKISALSLVALYFIFKQRARLAAIALSVAMIPTGFSVMEGIAGIAPYFFLLNCRAVDCMVALMKKTKNKTVAAKRKDNAPRGGRKAYAAYRSHFISDPKTGQRCFLSDKREATSAQKAIRPHR